MILYTVLGTPVRPSLRFLTMNSFLETPKGLRLHIGLFGLCNVGKSTLMNALTQQTVAIVSPTPGTTTDPVEKTYELHPVGPVVFIDTAGVDDLSELGKLRVARTLNTMKWVDLAILVTTAKNALSSEEMMIVARCQQAQTPLLIVINKIDQTLPDTAFVNLLRSQSLDVIQASASLPNSIDALRQTLISSLQSTKENDKPLTETLVGANETVLLVTPIDSGTPKGRLILPQVQTIRELLDKQARCIVVPCTQVSAMLNELKHPPKLIITDSQVVEEVAQQCPGSIPLTTFSILMSYSKSDLIALAKGAAVLSSLRSQDRILICETCSHHPQTDDIGRIKIPRLLREKIHPNLIIDFASGKDIPDDLSPYRLIIQCGGCVVSRRHMLSRLVQAQDQGVPMTNYGMVISFLKGILLRILSSHPTALAAYTEALNQQKK